MNEDDYAIVIGIGRYPLLRPPMPGAPHDLQGPSLDANEMNNWLADPAGGGVPKDNRLLVTSDMYPDPFPTQKMFGREEVLAKPSAVELSGCFGWLVQRFENSGGLKLGRRLYVYFSGHGFCVDDCDGGVYAANANPGILHHFYVRSWFDWFYRNAYFEEFVLWMDACSDPIPINGAPNAAAMPNQMSADFPEGRRFVAFSARHPLKSVERRMPDGNIRGVFTYALLKGLKGAAADGLTGRVTAASLRDYLHGSMGAFQTQQDRDNPDIGSEPAFGPVDEISFGQRDATTFDRMIRFDARHTGRKAVIVNGTFQPVVETVASGDTWTVSLPSGLYKLEVAPDTRRILEVNGESADEIIVT